MKVTSDLQKMLDNLKTPKVTRLEDIKATAMYPITAPVTYVESDHDSLIEILKHGFYPLDNIYNFELERRGKTAWKDWDIIILEDEIYMDDFQIGGALGFTYDGYAMYYGIGITHNDTTKATVEFHCNISEAFDHRKIDVNASKRNHESIICEIEGPQEIFVISCIQDYIDAMNAWPAYVKTILDFFEMHAQRQIDIFGEFPASKKMYKNKTYTVKDFIKGMTYVKLAFQEYRQQHEKDIMNLIFDNDDGLNVINDWWVDPSHGNAGMDFPPRYPDAYIKAHSM